MQANPYKPTLPGGLAVVWGVGGFFLLLTNAIVHLAAISLQAFEYALTPAQWAVLVANIMFMSYSEGYKGFQQHYAPRFAARAKYLSSQSTTVEKLLAPLFCMSFFNATKKRLVVAYSLLAMILLFIFSFRLLPQPWRGVLDAGVVVGLIWGMASTAWYVCLAFSRDNYSVDPELRSGNIAPGLQTKT